ncbi:MAG: hypothetical protein ACKVS9_09235 [Phycisphaerae bacterium]
MKHVQTGVMLALIAGCGLWLTYYYKSQPEPGEPVAVRMPLACTACGKAYVSSVGRQPAKCLECGKDAAWRCRKCKACGTFVPLVKADGADKPTAECSKCKKKTSLIEVGANELPEK